MEVLYVFVLAISAVSSLGSAPYLPSGWRPSGPSFLLPSEVRTAPEPIATTSEPKILEAVVLPSEPAPLEDKVLESAVTPSEATSSQVNAPESTVGLSELTSFEVKTPDFTSISESTTSEGKTTESAITRSAETVQDVFSEETEASGSDFLREYGPPAILDIHQSITVQGLPDLVTENTFKVDDKKDELVTLTSKTGEEETATVNASAAAEEVSDLSEATVEPETRVEDVSVKIEATIQDKSDQKASTTEIVIVEEISENTTAKIEETIEEVGKTLSQSTTEETVKYEENSVLLVKSIDTEAQVTEGTSLEYLPPALNEVSKDNDVIAKDEAAVLEMLTNPSDSEDSDVVVKIKINQDEEKVEESSGLGQAPDGLGEQERVGFREYGPPKSGTEDKSETERIEANETRKRRFSSRFASFNRH